MLWGQVDGCCGVRGAMGSGVPRGQGDGYCGVRRMGPMGSRGWVLWDPTGSYQPLQVITKMRIKGGG